MTDAVLGHAGPSAAWDAALTGGALHHAWLLTGPEGVGKARWAHWAAMRLLATGAGEAVLPGEPLPAGSRTLQLAEAGSHPDLRVLARLPRDIDKPEAGLARSITVAQVRALQPLFATRPSLGRRRAVIIDAADDLERAGANALLKSLEEPPAGTMFLLVSHAPGRLLPTIRSRCRSLRFGSLNDEAMAAVLRTALPDTGADDLAALARAGEGSPGRALRYAGLDVAGLDRQIAAIAETGDPGMGLRAGLARSLGGKAAQARYSAFLERAVHHAARTAQARQGEALRIALDTHDRARDAAGAAIGLSLDATATVWEMAALLARLASVAA